MSNFFSAVLLFYGFCHILRESTCNKILSLKFQAVYCGFGGTLIVKRSGDGGIFVFLPAYMSSPLCCDRKNGNTEAKITRQGAFAAFTDVFSGTINSPQYLHLFGKKTERSLSANLKQIFTSVSSGFF